MSLYDPFSPKERELLRARAERIAHASADEEASDTITVLGVVVQGEHYALPIEALGAVFEQIHIVPVPSVPPFVKGIANVRGRIVPVLELGVLLNLPVQETTPAVIVAANQNVAFSVDEIGDVATFRADPIRPLSAQLKAVQSDYLRGTLPDGSALLDPETILNDPALIVEA